MIKAYFIGGSQDLTVRVIDRVEGIFRFPKMRWASPWPLPLQDDGPTMVPIAGDLDVYRLRGHHPGIAIYLHEDLFK